MLCYFYSSLLLLPSSVQKNPGTRPNSCGLTETKQLCPLHSLSLLFLASGPGVILTQLLLHLLSWWFPAEDQNHDHATSCQCSVAVVEGGGRWWGNVLRQVTSQTDTMYQISFTLHYIQSSNISRMPPPQPPTKLKSLEKWSSPPSSGGPHSSQLSHQQSQIDISEH